MTFSNISVSAQVFGAGVIGLLTSGSLTRGAGFTFGNLTRGGGEVAVSGEGVPTLLGTVESAILQTCNEGHSMAFVSMNNRSCSPLTQRRGREKIEKDAWQKLFVYTQVGVHHHKQMAI